MGLSQEKQIRKKEQPQFLMDLKKESLPGARRQLIRMRRKTIQRINWIIRTKRRKMLKEQIPWTLTKKKAN